MHNGAFASFFSLVIFSSCSSINLSYRTNKDVKLNATNAELLQGHYSNFSNDTGWLRQFIFTDSLHERQSLSVKVTPLGAKTLRMELFSDSLCVDSIILKGKYSQGYFKGRSSYDANFVAGPLFWTLYEDHRYIGLTKEHNLIFINSPGFGAAVLIIFPMFVANGSQSVEEYPKIR